jgi:hypothetical protein
VSSVGALDFSCVAVQQQQQEEGELQGSYHQYLRGVRGQGAADGDI